MEIKCLIIDDEPLAINIIKKYLEQIENFKLINTFTNALDALNFLKSNPVDLIFLDINMPVLDGLDFIKSLETPPLVIVTSAYDTFALETYELNVLDYLLKPVEFPRFLKALNKASSRLEHFKIKTDLSNDRPFIFVKVDKKKMKKIFLDDILTIESLKDYLKINTVTGKFIIHSTLANFTSLLPSNDFIRIHRSYTISLSKIDALEGNSVEIDGIRYVIGRSYIDEVKQKILDSAI